MEAIDRLYILVSDGDPLARRHIGRFLSITKEGDLKARAQGALAAYHVGKGHLTQALVAIRQGLAEVTSCLGLVELVVGRSAIALSSGQPSYAKALTDRALLETHDEPAEARAVALFGSAIAHAYSGALDVARQRWQVCLGLTGRPLYVAGARTNLGLLAIEGGRLTEAEDLLRPPLEGAPRMLRAQREIGLGRLAAVDGDFHRAAGHQAMALGLMGHRGIVDQAEVAVALVKYLYRAGELAEACEAAQAIGAIVLEMEDERHELAAAALTDLVCAGTAATLSWQLIESCAASLDNLSRGGRTSPSRGRRSLQPRGRSNSTSRQSSPT